MKHGTDVEQLAFKISFCGKIGDSNPSRTCSQHVLLSAYENSHPRWHFPTAEREGFEHYMFGTPFTSYSLRSVRYVQGFSNPSLKLRFKLLRRERDSNPRTSFPVAGFRNRCLRPLSHLSFTSFSRDGFGSNKFVRGTIWSRTNSAPHCLSHSAISPGVCRRYSETTP